MCGLYICGRWECALLAIEKPPRELAEGFFRRITVDGCLDLIRPCVDVHVELSSVRVAHAHPEFFSFDCQHGSVDGDRIVREWLLVFQPPLFVVHAHEHAC